MKVLVIGDSCEDVFVYGECKRLCPEAPVPVFTPIEVVKNPGMAANVKRNLEALGCEVDIITNEEKITKTRYVDKKSNQMFIRVDENDKVLKSYFTTNFDDFKKYDAIVVSDYNKGFLDYPVLDSIANLHPLTFLDTKKQLHTWCDDFTFVKVNESEWEKAGNYKGKNVIVTLGDKGCTYNGIIYPALHTKEVKDISGAGDTFLAGLVYNYLKTKDIKDSLAFANYCAGEVVQRKGVSIINLKPTNV